MFPTVLRHATFAGCAALALTLAPAAKAAPSTALAPTALTTTTSERDALREAIWRFEHRLRQRLARTSQLGRTPVLASEAKASELKELLAVMGDSAAKLGTADGAELARKAGRLKPLLRELERRERAGAGESATSSLWDPASSPLALDDSAGPSCEGALAVADGVYRAAMRARADGTRRELWLRYTAATAGAAVVSTAGSDFDTVVDWFDSCPGAGDEPHAHGDDEIGLQARAGVRLAAGETVWIRVRGWEQATGTAAIQVLGGAAGFGGTVTNETTGGPLSDRYIEVWNSNGFYASSTYSESDGTYLLIGLAPGTYFASTSPDYYPDGFLDELYDDLPCAGGALNGCSPTTGTPIVVPNGTIINGIDFALGRGAAIAGRVRQAANGNPVPYVDVYVYGSGGLAGWVETDQAGRYVVTGLGDGVAYALAGDDYGSEYARELYQGFSCTPSCTVTTGTPIPVTDGQTAAGIDFALERLGVVKGSVLRAADGTPVGYARVDILDAQGYTYSSGYASAAGDYVAGGLSAGTYFAKTQTYEDYLDELFDDVPCDYGCNVATGTPIPVTLDGTASGIDFELQKTGSISGVLTDVQTGDPLLDYSYVYAYDASGDYVVGSDYTYDGTYAITGLPAGTYYVRASHFPYRDELYDDIPCPANCDPTTGTPVTVLPDAATTGIDFALTPLGSIAGTVTDAASSALVASIQIEVWNSGGFVAYAYTGNDGTYKINGLAPGSYFVVAEHYAFIDELYDNIPCPGGPPAGCNPTSGTSVAVSLGMTTSAIDFALVRKGGIAGTVRDAATSAPLPNPWVTIYDAGGAYVTSLSGASDGTYKIEGLQAGNYFVIADSYYSYTSSHDAELYDNLPCPGGACNPTTGTAVPVALGALTTGIDFGLSRSGVISGLVTDKSGTPLSYIYVDLYDATGDYQSYATTNAQGRYEIATEPGTYYLLAYGGSQYTTQLYLGIPCSGGCNVTSGTPVPVTTATATPNINFVLSFSRGIVGTVTDHGHPLAGVAIDLWNAAGVHVTSTVTGPSGGYHLEQPDAGTYYVSTDSGMGAVEEVWNNVPCPLGPAYQGLCNPTSGTPITMSSWSSLVSGIDFALDGVEVFVNGFEPGNRPWSARTP